MQDFDVNHLFFWEPILFGGTPFAINRVVVLMWVASILCMAFLLAGARRGSLVPKRVQYLVESGYLFVRNNIAIDVIGPKDGPKYAHYLATLFFFIFFSNLLEIVPGINFPVTSRMAIPAALAVLTWIVFNLVGVVKQGPLNYVKGIAFPPGVPKPIYILLTPIEILSTFIVRPFTLAIRLFANMVAGHTLLAIFFLFTNDFLRENISVASPFGLLTLVISCVLIVFELLVISLQAYIFTMLTASYIAEAVHGHGDEHEEESEAVSARQKTQHETEGIAA